MALGHEVCTYVINCMCRKFFLDERPTISLKHYFFSCVSVSVVINILFCFPFLSCYLKPFAFVQLVFMSDSKDYSYVEHCFNGAAKVLPLPLCEMVSFCYLYYFHCYFVLRFFLFH